MSAPDRTLPVRAVAGAGAARQPAAADRVDVADSFRGGLGMLPLLSLLGALGLLLVALGFNRARVGLAGADLLFWGGMLCIALPAVARVAWRGVGRGETLLTTVAVGVLLYLVKIVHSPIRFTFFDEFSHWSAAMHVGASGRLFGDNTLLPIAAEFPGLHIIATAIQSVSGAELFLVGALTVGVARVLWTLALFLLFERIAGSARAAGLATLFYMANPSYLFFHGQFAYESLALPLVALLLFALARAEALSGPARFGMNLAVVLGVGALVMVHHLSSYALIVFLVVWLFASWRLARAGAAQRARQGTLVFALVVTLAWLVYFAMVVVSYISPHVESGVAELFGILFGQATPRELFVSGTGDTAPLGERLVGFASVGLICLALAAAVPWALRHRRDSALAWTMAVCALAYPAAMALRLTTAGAEIAVRTSGFLFLAMAPVIAMAAEALWLERPGPRPAQAIRVGILTLAAAVIVTGGVVLGFAPWARLPGPYQVAADTRSVERQGIAAAVWMQTVLGPGNRVAADRTNRLLVATYGQQTPVTNYRDRVDIASIYYAETLDERVRATIRQGELDYLLVDLRMSRAAPQLGHYIEDGELRFEDADGRPLPVPERLLRKFDDDARIDRVLDSGSIIVYDLARSTR